MILYRSRCPRNVQLISLLCAVLGTQAARAHTPCKKVVWMTALAGQMTRYTELMRVALHSAALNAPSIVPVIIAEENLLTTPQMNDLARFMKGKGAILVPHRLTFLHDFSPKSHAYKVRGTFTRLECGLVLKRLVEQGRLDPLTVDTNFILYADLDVMFLQDVDSCSLVQPAIALLGAETIKGVPSNAGVLYINVSAWNTEHAAIVKHGRAGKWNFNALDQGLILEYFGKRLEVLPDSFNWKGYWGYDERAVILHFHGPKPGHCLECLCTHPIVKAGKACGYGACKGLPWAAFYTDYTLDEGSFYKTILIIYYRYLADTLSAQYGIRVARHEVMVG